MTEQLNTFTFIVIKKSKNTLISFFAPYDLLYWCKCLYFF